MCEDESRDTSSVKENFSKIVAFHKEYMMMHNLISDTITLYCKYWNEYLKPHPSNYFYNLGIDSIIYLGYKVSVNCEQMEVILKHISFVSSNNVKALIDRKSVV